MNANNDEGKLISGKEALIALANGEKVQWAVGNGHWIDGTHENTIDLYLDEGGAHGFRIKPKTISINGIKVKKPKGINIFNGTTVKLYCETTEQAKELRDALRQVFGGAV